MELLYDVDNGMTNPLQWRAQIQTLPLCYVLINLILM